MRNNAVAVRRNENATNPVALLQLVQLLDVAPEIITPSMAHRRACCCSAAHLTVAHVEPNHESGLVVAVQRERVLAPPRRKTHPHALNVAREQRGWSRDVREELGVPPKRAAVAPLRGASAASVHR